MNCPSCGVTLPDEAHSCPSCVSLMNRTSVQPPAAGVPTLKPITSSSLTEGDGSQNAKIRKDLLDCYIGFSISKELYEWLHDLGQIPNGTLEEKMARIREHTNRVVVPSETSPRQTIFYLSQYGMDTLSEICQEFGLSSEGSKETLCKRIYGEVGLRDGWLLPDDARLLTKMFLSMLERFGYENDVSLNLGEDVSDLLANEKPKHPLAHESALTTLMIPDLLQEAHGTLLQDEFTQEGLDLLK
jgi:hypothetical protein